MPAEASPESDIDDLEITADDLQGGSTESVDIIKPLVPAKPAKVESEISDNTEVVAPVVPANDELKAALAELAKSNKETADSVRALSTPVAKPPTPEELAKRWNVYNPTPEFLQKYFGLTEDQADVLADKAKVFAEMRDGLVKQSITATQHIVAQLRAEFKSQLDAIESWRSEQETKNVRGDFNSRYAVFADGKYDKILKAVATELAEGEFKSNAEYFDALAKGAAEYITGIVPDFVLGDPAKTATPSTGKMPKLPRTSVGGTGGTKGGVAPTKSASDNDIDSLG